MSGTTTIEFAFFEQAPFTGAIGEPDRLSDECADLPDEFRDTLAKVLVDIDNTRCARCTEAAGFVITENHVGVEYTYWHPTGVARFPDGPVSVLCQDCTPYLPV